LNKTVHVMFIHSLDYVAYDVQKTVFTTETSCTNMPAVTLTQQNDKFITHTLIM